MKLANNSVLEIAGLKFVFLINQDLIEAIRLEASRMYQSSSTSWNRFTANKIRCFLTNKMLKHVSVGFLKQSSNFLKQHGLFFLIPILFGMRIFLELMLIFSQNFQFTEYLCIVCWVRNIEEIKNYSLQTCQIIKLNNWNFLWSFFDNLKAHRGKKC